MTSRTCFSASLFFLFAVCPFVLLAQTTGAPAPVPQEPVVSGPPSPAPPVSESEMLEKRGDVQMARKNYREAGAIYQKSLQLMGVNSNPPEEKKRGFFGTLFWFLGGKDRDQSDQNPRSAVLHNKIGIAYHQQFLFADAKRYYERAIKLNRKYAEAINNLGTIHYGQKKYRAAINQYRKALQLSPDSASIYSNIGTAYFANKKYEEAFAAYIKALELDPEVFEHRSTYGVLLQERSVEDRARFHYFMAKTYASAGMFDRALSYLRKALEEGFKEREKIPEDPAFAELVKTEAFVQLMANPPPPLPQ